MRRALAVCLLLLGLTAARADAAAVPAEADYSQAYITEADGTILHTDILRPKGLAKDAKTPVIMSIGPYFGHGGQEGVAGADPSANVADPGPSDRFLDLYEQGQLAARGYTFMYVDLRGYGGSSGCYDLYGPGEQADIKAAVEWAASQPWSNGKVGLYGKSYDAETGMMALAQQPKGLAAVVAQETDDAGYNSFFTHGEHDSQSLTFAGLYPAIGETDLSLRDDPQYIANAESSPPPTCEAGTLGITGNDPNSDFWKVRGAIPGAKGVKTPTFITEGILDDATRTDGGSVTIFDELAGPKHLWFGWWEHVRGNDPGNNASKFTMGRKGFIDQVMRFYGQYLKGETPSVVDPVATIETGDGTWRADDDFPPSDATPFVAPLKDGSYTDDGQNDGSADTNSGSGTDATTSMGAGPGHGSWTFSPPLTSAAHLSGVPTVTLDLAGAISQTNVAVNLYDLDPSGKALMLARGAMLLPGAGKQTFTLSPTDWVFQPGHRIGVLVSSNNGEWYIEVPTQATVSFTNSSINLPILKYTRPDKIDGSPSDRLTQWLTTAPFAVDAATVTAATSTAFGTPPAAVARPVALDATKPAAAKPVARKLSARYRLRGRKLSVSGRGPVGAIVRVTVSRGKKRVAKTGKKVVSAKGRYAFTVKVPARTKTKGLKVRVTATQVGFKALGVAAKRRK